MNWSEEIKGFIEAEIRGHLRKKAWRRWTRCWRSCCHGLREGPRPGVMVITDSAQAEAARRPGIKAAYVP